MTIIVRARITTNWETLYIFELKQILCNILKLGILKLSF